MDKTDPNDFELNGPLDPLRDPYAHLPAEEAARRHEADDDRHAREQRQEHLDDQAANTPKGRRFGYVRVSTDRQDSGSDAQRRALEQAGCTEIIEERASGRKARPALAALVEQLGAGDTLTVFRFDRISRGVADFYAIGARISEKGASLRSICENFDTGTGIGRAMMGFAAIWAELEADTIRERVQNGLKAARARGVHGGRPRVMSEAAEREVVDRLERGESPADLGDKYRVSSRTIMRIRRRHAQKPLPF